jgi:AdoMet dependent proline di-methyltransferase
MGGLQHLNGIDIHNSRLHIERLISKYGMGTGRCLDCGSGVGRITKELHSNIFDKVDLLEPDQGFMDQARVS